MGDTEELQEGESVVVHLIAGAVAGTAEHCGMFPVDTIKARNIPLSAKENTDTNHRQTCRQ